MILKDARPLKRGLLARMLDYCFSSFISVGVFFIFLAAWELANHFVGDFVLAAPLNVLARMLEIICEYERYELLTTLKRAFIGSSLSLALGIVLAVLSYNYKSFLLFIKPIISISLSTVPIAWVVLALFWFSSSTLVVIFVVVVCTFSYTFQSTLNALLSVPQGIINMSIIYKFNLAKRLLRVYLPYALSYLLPASFICVCNSIKLTIMAELLGAANGIGAQISDARAFLDNESVLAFLLLCVLFAAFFEFFIIKNLELIIYKDKDV